MAIREPRVFTIPPGAPFLPTLARALLDGRLIDGFPQPGEPLALASATIFVPTQRSAEALAGELLAMSGKPGLLLPRIAPLGAFEPDESAAFFTSEDEPPRLGLPPAVGDIARLHTLARLVRAWGKALKGAIRTTDADGLVFDEREPPLVATTPAQCYALAGDLAALIDDMIIEGVDWRRLNNLAPEGYDFYWRITLNFLRIAVEHWPQWLEGMGLVDRASRLALVVKSEIARLESGALGGPTIIAGSTGANRATAELIAAIARSEGGAVVLAGLDVSLDDRAWSMVGVTDDAGYGSATHPQALLRRLVGLIGVNRGDVKELGAPPPALRNRTAFLSEALRPAETTDAWAAPSAALTPLVIDAALEGLSIIVADNETEEALALAVAMREVLETPGKTAALVTPDVSIARRVSAELSRWGVKVEDSAGRSLGQTEAGALARLILIAAVRLAPIPAQALLDHGAVRLGRSRRALEQAARALELGVFRAAPLSTLDNLDSAFAAARSASQDRHAHPATRFLREEERNLAESLLRDLVAALAPLRGLKATSTLGECLEAHRASLGSMLAAPGGEGSSPHGLEPLDEMMASWREAANDGFGCSLDQYAALFDDAVGRVRAPPVEAGHPRLKILGLLESRLLAFDRVLIAGLDEKVWPPAVETDAFLNRPMRARLGLSPPERRIGQTAHDFSSALGAPEAVLSRARKRGGEPTVASRFLQRMVAAAGASSEAVAAAERRGETYLTYARLLDEPDKVEPIRPPKPKPPVELRPRSLSVTRIETLRRDPYSIYAQRILRLEALAPIEQELDARAAGEAWHAALQDFAERYPSGSLPPGAGAKLAEFARQRFAPMLEDPAFAGLAWPNIERAIGFVIDFEQRARDGIERIFVERQGEIDIPLFDGSAFRLTARADRIDVLRGGGARIIDYKSGSPPSQKQVKSGLAPQLTLEAAILMSGGFAGLEAMLPAEAMYLKLGGANGGREAHAAGEEADVAKLANDHLVELKALLDQFASAETPYLSRPLPEFAGRFGEYDHLARVKEWSSTAGASDAEGAVGG
ncbi:MAG TPA: double-strand break repair protein AddB [Roseiarcus sp.]|nr:double-strand break repair protein AddB [Roseiarcus sp.]